VSSAMGHRARKRFGQNFLHDAGVIAGIAAAVAPRAGQHLLEIGPGRGALTEALLHSPLAQLDAIELDRDLVPLLQARFAQEPRLRVHSGDALRLQLTDLAVPGTPLRIVGNLPYNISTPLLFHLLSQRAQINDMHFMLQREVVDRLAAEPGNKDWGRLGILIQYYCAVTRLFEVPPGAFTPAPKVMSGIVRLTLLPESQRRACDMVSLDRVVRSAFAHRRKTLRNNLAGVLGSDALADLDIDPGARAETLTLNQFIDMANYLHDHP